MNKLFLGGVSVFFAASIISSQAVSQKIEEIVVTAQKRAESLQDVSVSVDVTSGEAILDSGVKDLELLSQQLPAINVSKGGASDQMYIRGIGSGFNGGFEQAVGTYVDGVYIGRSRGSRSSFVDLQQIEVLKGPQSLYFGNSSIAGALSLTSKNPGDEFGGHVSALYEPDHGETSVEAAVDLPLSDQFAVRIAARKYDLDGYVSNTTTGQDVGSADDAFFRITAAWNPSEELSVLFKHADGESERIAPFIKEIISCPSTRGSSGATCARQQALVDNSRNFEIQGGGDDFTTSEFSQTSLEVNYDFGGSTLTYVAASLDNEQRELQDLDSGPLALFNANQYDELDQTNHELRLASNGEGDLDWMFGIYSQDGDVLYDVSLMPYFIGAPPFQASIAAVQATGRELAARNAQLQNEKTTSAFGSVTWSLNDANRLIAGLRYIKVEKDLIKDITWGTYADVTLSRESYIETAAPFGGFSTVGSTSGNSEWDDVLPTLIWERDLNSGNMLYLSYAAGFKAGGFNLSDRNGALTPNFDEETVDAYELGFKGDFMDGAMRLNMALFYSDYEGVQASVLDPVTFTFAVGNAATSSTKGLDFNLQYAASENLQLNANLVFMDAKYDDFIGSCSQLLIDTGTCDNALGVNDAQDWSGHETTFAPGYSGNLSAIYTTEVGGLSLSIEPSIYLTDSYFIQQDFDPFTEQDSFVKLNLRVALSNADETWEVSLLGKNLNDEDTIFFANDLPGGAGAYVNSLSRPQTLAVQARFNW